MNNLSNIPWFRNAGVEFTRILPYELDACVPKDIRKKERAFQRISYFELSPCQEWKGRERDRMGDILDKFTDSIDRDTYHKLFKDIGFDPYCVEMSSAVLNDWESLKQFFTMCDNFGERNGLLRQHDEVCGTGGHIHVAINDKFEAYKVIRAMMNHPEVMFAFAAPADNQHGLYNLPKSLAFQSKDFIQNCLRNDVPFRINYYNKNFADQEKQSAVAFRQYDTVEFRLFDVAQNWEMQEEHMAFAQQFVRYAVDHPEQMPILYREEIDRRSPADHIANFLKLVDTLGLPVHRYKQYYPEMIKLRFDWGTENYKV